MRQRRRRKEGIQSQHRRSISLDFIHGSSFPLPFPSSASASFKVRSSSLTSSSSSPSPVPCRSYFAQSSPSPSSTAATGPTLLPPPPPPPMSYRTIHTPPPTHSHPHNPPHQSSFRFNAPNYAHRPIEEDRPISTKHLHDFTYSHRVSNRMLIDNDRPRHNLPDFDHCNPENRIGVWNPTRVLSDNRPSRPYSPLDFDREYPVDNNTVSPYPTVNKLRYDAEGSSRLRMEHIDRYEVNTREDFVWGRGDETYHRRGNFASNVDTSSGNFGIVPSQITLSRDIDSKSGGYVQMHGDECDNGISRGSRRESRNGLGESKRWVNDRKVPRDLHDSSFELGSNEMGADDDDDGIQIMSGKREYYASEFGRYNRGSREDAHEFSRPPKKQTQKKSALRRIQMVKPMYRNREIEQLHYTSYVDDSNSNSFRGKDQLGYSGYGIKAEERERSPVELDISFKSNSLVAKAIVAPSSSAIVFDKYLNLVSDTDLTPSEKNKKVLVSDSDCPDLQQAKPSMGAVNLNNSPSGANDTSSSGKGLNLRKNASDSCSQPFSIASNDSLGKNDVAQCTKKIVSDETTKICSGKTSSRLVKKRKIVKKLVKKLVVNPNSHVSMSLSANMLDGTVQPGSGIPNPSFPPGSDKFETPMMEKITAVDKASMLDSLPSLPIEGNLLPGNIEGNIPPLSLGSRSRSQECETNEDSDIGQTSSNEISENISISQLCASSNKDRKSDSDCLHADNSKLLTGSTFSDISKMDDVNKHSSQNEVSLSPGKNSNEGFSENSYHVGDNADCRLLSLADNVINTDPINTYNSVNGRDLGSNSNDIMIMGKSQEKIKVCDINIDGIVDEGRCKNTASTVSQDAILEENPETAILVPSCGTLSLSNSGKSRIQEGAECLQSSSITKQGSDFDSTFLEGDVTIPHCGFMNNSGKQVPPSDVTVFPEICASDRVPNSKISVGFGDVPTNWIKKRKVRTDLNFLSSQIDGISIDTVSLVEPSYVGDTLKDSSLSAVLDPGIQSLDSSLQSNVDGVAVLHGKKGVPEAEVYVGDNGNDDSNGASPMSKRKKFTVNHRSFIPSQAQFSEAIVVTTSCAEVPTSTSVNQLHQKEVVLSSMTILSTAPTYPEEIAKFPDYSLVGRSFESMDAYMNTVSSEHLELQDPSIASHSLPEELPVPNVQFSEREGNSKQNSTPIVPINNTEKDILLIGNISGEKIDIQAEEEKHRFTDFAQRSPRADMESNDLSMKKILPPEQNCVPCLADGDGVSTSNSNDELIDAVPGPLSDICSPRTTYGVSDGRISDCRAFHDDSMCGVNESVDRHSMVDHGIDLPACAPTTEYTMKDMKCDHATGRNNLMMGKIVPQGPQPSQVCSKFVTQGMNSSCSELKGGKSQSGGVIPRTFLGQSSFNFAKSKTPASSTHISKPRTWHRSSNNSLASLPRSKPLAGIVPLKGPISGKKRNFQNTSYIRKGNSLVRKPAPFSASPLGSSVNQSPSLGLDELQKSTRSEGGVDITDQPNLLKTGVTSSPLERQRTLSLPIDTEFPNHTTTSSEEIRSSPMIEPVSIGCCESASDAKKLGEINDALNYAEYALKCTDTPENQTGPSNNEESPVEANDGNMSSLNTKKIVYVKRKSNQLVATSNSCDLSVSTDDKAQSASSDGYYKRSKNQLIRTTFENINQTVGAPNGTANSDRQGTGKVPCNRRFSKRRSHKVAGRSCKPLRASLVWTLCGTNSSKNSFGSVHHQKVLPHLFPWKRATYLRSFIHNPALNSNTSSLPAISKKLLLLRKRDTIYTRSTHGLSLRKSKVLGVAGSSLKWSKSIENRSKKANEEATLAVAAVERKKREQKDATCISSRAKRERIFRIGLVRYRMDPSRRTLQRISDDESMSSASIRSGLDAKRSYIPRRLVIGNDEYVHIGNGNQLIRDPKKRTRILANEKVRWSLHTARQRLARRQKYCQFFTRFGKCNKDDGKCPYIHDPSKIAVCTKFLNGLCSTPNCNLTHKVIPERMPDCSYFLQGLCSNRNCPYRHVSVNPKASICEGFLRGYCAEGNECRKKHSYVCPAFEATGTCAQGTKCKLHHPKKHKGKKRRRSGDQKNRRGRYFGSMPVDVSEPGMMVAPRQCQKNNDDLEGELADYISLDVDDEITESISQSVEQETLFDSDPLDLQLDNLDELIKPVLIMKKNFTAQSSTVQ